MKSNTQSLMDCRMYSLTRPCLPVEQGLLTKQAESQQRTLKSRDIFQTIYRYTICRDNSICPNYRTKQRVQNVSFDWVFQQENHAKKEIHSLHCVLGFLWGDLPMPHAIGQGLKMISWGSRPNMTPYLKNLSMKSKNRIIDMGVLTPN